MTCFTRPLAAGLLAAGLATFPRHAVADGDSPMARADGNGDGVISLQEALDHAADRFRAMDANGDGELTLDEYLAGSVSRPGADIASGKAEREGRFATLDTDGNGTISLDEMLAGARASFGAADTNSDGGLARLEWRAFRF
jgi:hypothetical protein